MGRPKGSINKVQETIKEEIQAVQVEVKPKVRRLSGDEDKMGAQHPLCMNCGHREDMHHDWKEVHHSAITKNPMTGAEIVREWTDKFKIYDRARLCQHACKCQAFE